MLYLILHAAILNLFNLVYPQCLQRLIYKLNGYKYSILDSYLQSLHQNKVHCAVCQWLVTGQWFSPGTPVSSTNKIDRHDITESGIKHPYENKVTELYIYNSYYLIMILNK